MSIGDALESLGLPGGDLMPEENVIRKAYFKLAHKLVNFSVLL